jgi:DNA-binding FrmR family transcriptional regulator
VTNKTSKMKGLLSGLQEMEEGGDDLNPILQVPLLVTGDEGTVYIDVLPQEVEGEEQRLLMGGFGSGNHGIQNQMLAIQSAVNSVRRETIDIRSEMRETNLPPKKRKGSKRFRHRKAKNYLSTADACLTMMSESPTFSVSNWIKVI